jgi:hypothetical protein
MKAFILNIIKGKSPPVLLARSHRWVYVSPVGGRNVEQKNDDGEGEREVVYYRIFAKEQGSGTDVSLSSTGLSG